ncbi:MAG TPA: ABC transporter substrate-binding protein [Candidatus Nitrosopolaris sp.]|nr:ABC transporter substrate-binding protein [Candidatus Nitrosopolaris sp.]
MNVKIKLVISAVIIAGVIASSLLYSNPVFTFSNNNNSSGSSSNILRIGYFPILNHAQAVIGLGNGDFQKALGTNIVVKPQIFDSGPSLIEALFANQIDVAFVGPNPTINGYIVSDGKALKIISGASSGGTVFVVRNDSGIQSTRDFANRKFASPQLGNTQDVALRTYLLENGYKTKENGGTVQVISAKSSDIFTSMLKKQIDGAWVPEPWGAKLVKEANARIFLDERILWPGGKFATALIISRTDYLHDNPEIIMKLLAVHVDETNWINHNKAEAMQVFNTELKKLTGHTIIKDELEQASSRIDFTYDPLKQSLFKSAKDAFKIGFLKKPPNLVGIYDLTLLNEVLNQKGFAKISEG